MIIMDEWNRCFFAIKQSLKIFGATGGTFKIILQGIQATDPLSLDASETTIANALIAAAARIRSAGYEVECERFLVSKEVFQNLEDLSSSMVRLNITFQSDNDQPLTQLILFVAELSGSSDIRFEHHVVQYHTPLPTGSILVSLNYSAVNQGRSDDYVNIQVEIPFDASEYTFQKALQNAADEVTVRNQIL